MSLIYVNYKTYENTYILFVLKYTIKEKYFFSKAKLSFKTISYYYLHCCITKSKNIRQVELGVYDNKTSK